MALKYFKTALRFAIIGLLIGSLPFFWLILLKGADFIEGYVGIVIAADIFGRASCGWRICPDFGGILHIFTAPISWALYFFIIGYIKSIRSNQDTEMSRKMKLSLIVAVVLHILAAGIFYGYADKYSPSISPKYGQLFIAVSLLVWLASEFGRARILLVLSIVLLIFALLSPFQTIISSSKVRYNIKNFDVRENALLGLSDPNKAYENCNSVGKMMQADPSARRTLDDVSAFERSCFNELAVKTKDPVLCGPLSKIFPGDLAGCIYRIATRNKAPSLCSKYQKMAIDFEEKLKTENKWPYTDNSPRFDLSECLRIVAEQEVFYTR